MTPDRKIIFGLLIALVILVTYCVDHPDNFETIEKIDTVRIVEVDTIWQQKTDTIYMDRTVWKTKIVKQDTIIYQGDTIPVNTYQGSEQLENGLLTYDISVLGEMYSSSFRFDYTLPQITKTITNNITKEITKYPSGFYLSANFNTRAGPGIGVMYLKSRSAITYHYAVDKSHTIGYGYRIF